MVKKLDRLEFDQALESDKPVVIDFYADWCGPCRLMAPSVEQVSDEYQGMAHFYKIDVDKNAELASQYGVRGIPTLLFIKDGRVEESLVGNQPIEEIRATIQKVGS